MKTITMNRIIRNANKEAIELTLEVTGWQIAKMSPWKFLVKIINSSEPIEFAGVNTGFVFDGAQMRSISNSNISSGQSIESGFGEINRQNTDQITLFKIGGTRFKKDRFFLYLNDYLNPQDFKNQFKDL